jgi:hypothetical protein
MMASPNLRCLLAEFDRALCYTEDLQRGLTAEQIVWRPEIVSSAIGWHLGHQAAVAHYMVRNLIAAEPRIDPDLDALMDSATPERDRGDLPSLERILEFREAVAERVHDRVVRIDEGAAEASSQLRVIASTLLVALINHEYQHDKWIGEVRADVFGLETPPPTTSDRVTMIDGYAVVTDPA